MIRLPAQAIHTVSEASREDMMHFGVKDSSKVIVVPNGINLKDHFHNDENIEYQDFALFIGRLVEYKNLDVVIAAFSKVAKTLPQARLVIVGDGPARRKWEEVVSKHHLSKNIEFVGYVSEQRKEEMLKNCSMILFPSLIEGFGLVILEAFAHRKPVIASDVKPQNEIIDDAIDGFLLPPSDVNSWAEKIEFLFNNKQACEMMGNCGRSKAEIKYDISQTASDIESIYRKFIIDEIGSRQEHNAIKQIQSKLPRK
jgi:glycosyltransferase involved in cell wall biosynthesis